MTMSGPNQTWSDKVYILAIYVKGYCDLDLYQIDPKINKKHLLSMKFKKAGPNWTRL